MTNNIIRIPILLPKVINREPIIDPLLFEIVKYYNENVAILYGSVGFNSLPKRYPWAHRNFKFFLEVYNLMKEFNWNYKQYIDAQFERAAKTAKMNRRPYPNQLCSSTAISYYCALLDKCE
jgi:hypothetical protein